MKITKEQLKQIIKEELEMNEAAPNAPEKLLGDIHVRLEPIIVKVKEQYKKARAAGNNELEDMLNDLLGELRMYQNSTFKYKDLGDIR